MSLENGGVGLPITDAALRRFVRQEQRNNPNYRRDRTMTDPMLSGYQDYLGIDISSLARDSLAERKSFIWYDMCSGDSNALKEFMYKFKRTPGITLQGIDIDTKDKSLYGGSLIIHKANVVTEPLPSDIDLITCVNALYLINKYVGFPAVSQVMEKWYNALRVGGLLATVREGTLQRGEFDILASFREQLGENALSISKGGRNSLGWVHITRVNPDPISLQ